MTTTWNPSDKAAAFTLSNGNLTAVVNTNTGGQNIIRAIVSATLGKFYFECSFDTSAHSMAIGVADGSLVLSGTLLGGDTHGCGALLATSGNVVNYNNSSLGASPNFNDGDVGGIAIDVGSHLFWIANVSRAPTVWNAGSGANPATGVGGYSFSGIGSPLFASLDIFSVDTNTKQATANFGGSAFIGSIPAGFGLWGAAQAGWVEVEY